ncbi:PREDICTED: vegetative cell wall protein gp1-like, partial [Vollenhovia emeryi]|uniref:vegetative cell wall protein gp1-like n=1 Tax=Vollenhovia emeryi TaxID=411798 RepID=UPI0005F3E569
MEQRDELGELFGDISDLDDLWPVPIDPGPTTSPESAPRPRVPSVGTRIQRGDAESRRRAIFLTEPVPPRPARRRSEPIGGTRPSTPRRSRTEETGSSPEISALTAAALARAANPPRRVARPRDASQPPPSSPTPHRTTDMSGPPRTTDGRPPPADRAPANTGPQPPTVKPRAAAPAAPPATTRPPPPANRPPASKEPRPAAGRPRVTTTAVPPTTARPIVSAAILGPRPPAAPATGNRPLRGTHQPPGPSPPPPPIPVTLPSGERVSVPYFAAHKNRKFRARTPSALWVIRFDTEGR